MSWNIVVVVSDTLRTAYLSPYGNDWVHTPNLARFAEQSVRFTNAHPECLPTIPTRRTLHTGRRAYPFSAYTPVPWDNVYTPGWQPMSSDEPAIAESLVRNGYHTGFFADVPHYFVPGMNFTRGFQTVAVCSRGQAEDQIPRRCTCRSCFDFSISRESRTYPCAHCKRPTGTPGGNLAHCPVVPLRD